MSYNIDTLKRQKFYCRFCARDHFSDSMIGQHHQQLLKKGYKPESPKDRYKRFKTQRKAEERHMMENLYGRY